VLNSLADTSRHSPGINGCDASEIAPMALRTNLSVGKPTAAVIRLT
jgi:hypothetical protein